MRELKFRAWSKNANQWASDTALQELITIGIPDESNSGIFDVHDYGLQKFELMQYTGLKDKNGKEIYEGDIVVEYYQPYNDTDDFKRGDPKEVKWSTSYKPGFDLPTQISENIEVIGNIYENPELLK
jgi:uncharacterized phage protein (TIGR01671 family)